MKFKMSAADFELLVKYYQAKCKGSDITFYQDNRETNLKIDVTDIRQAAVTIEFYYQDANMSPRLTKKVSIGDEL